MDKFKFKYRIDSARLKNWNYSSEGLYFVTICTQNMDCYFGRIENGKMLLNDLGLMVESEWLKSPEIRPDMNLELGEFIIMPNHFHGILYIGINEFNVNLIGRDAMHCVSTNKYGPQSKNLASIIRGFKSSVSTFARKNNIAFNWQSRYYDHIIRNNIEFQNISNYIQTNPLNWEQDEFYS